MRTVILCGGQGTRLREETEFRPKPLVDVGGRPILWHIMRTYAAHGLTDFVLCLGYRGAMIKQYFLDCDAINNDFTIRLGHDRRISFLTPHVERDYEVTLVDTGLDTMTGGRLARVAKHLPRETFMLTYGDGLSDVDLTALLKFHRGHGRLATLTAVRPTSRFGQVDLAADGRILDFAEKPRMESWISAGFFVFEPEVLSYLGGDDCVLEREPLERLARDGQLMAYRHPGEFLSMDTYRDYLHLNELWASGKAPWKVWE